MAKQIVTLLGLGLVGSQLVERLARLGYSLRVIDRDRVYEDELGSSSLYVADDVQKFKAKQAKKALETVAPKAVVKAFHEELTKDNAFLLQGDLVIDASNNQSMHVIVQAAAKKNKIPLLTTHHEGVKGLLIINPKAVKSKNAEDALTKLNATKAELQPGIPHALAGLAVVEALALLKKEKRNPKLILLDASTSKITTKTL